VVASSHFIDVIQLRFDQDFFRSSEDVPSLFEFGLAGDFQRDKIREPLGVLRGPGFSSLKQLEVLAAQDFPFSKGVVEIPSVRYHVCRRQVVGSPGCVDGLFQFVDLGYA